MEPCQHHQWNICLEALSKDVAKCMKELLDESEALNDSDLIIHFDPASFVMAIDKESSLTCNYSKGMFKLILFFLKLTTLILTGKGDMFMLWMKSITLSFLFSM